MAESEAAAEAAAGLVAAVTPPPGERWFMVHGEMRETDDGGFEVVATRLPGCATHGDTADECLANFLAGAAGLVEEYLAGGGIPWAEPRAARRWWHPVAVVVKVPNGGGG